jgi:cytochrome c oxidase cbb3-type subunit III
MSTRSSLMIAVLGCTFAITQLVAQPPAGPPGGPGGPPGAPGGSGGAGRAGRGGGRAGGFPQYTRQLASQDVLVRGKSLYDSTCSSCHAADLRGVLGKGVNVLRSGPVYLDQHGEILTGEIAKHKPALTLVPADVTAIAEYLHSVQATMGGQGSPPGRNPTDVQLTILVGNAAAGKTYFDGHCASCHSITGDLKGIGAKYADDPRGLQNTWVGGAAGGGGRGGRGGGGGGQATVTLASGEKFQGRVVKSTDFLIVLTTADNVRHTWPIVNGSPKVEVVDPQAAHKKMALEMDDPDNKNMHDVTAYLATLK